MFKIKRYIPNFITSLNVLCGSLSIVLAFESYIDLAGYCILFAAFFDFLDGLSARVLKAYSPMGKELDSLADMISFGLAPAVIAYHIMKTNVLIEQLHLDSINGEQILFLSSILLIPIFSALRLAKFNVDTRQEDSFIGLPTPSNAIIYASMPVIMLHNPFSKVGLFFGDKTYLAFLIVFLSWLLVAPIPMFSLKFKDFSFKKYKLQVGFLIACLFIVGFGISQRFQFLIRIGEKNGFGSVLVELFHIFIIALPLIIFLYILLSLLRHITQIVLKK